MTTTAFRTVGMAAFAFICGFAAAHAVIPAGAASPAPAMTPAYYPNLTTVLPAPVSPSPNTSRVVASADGASVTYLVGTLPAHYHATSNEFQYVISGTGREILGKCEVALQPGTFLVIPAKTLHSGMVVTGTQPLKLLAVKSPPGTDHIAAPLPASPPPCKPITR